MAMQSRKNLQEVLLNTLRREKQIVTVFLTNGFQMRGTIIGFDSFIVVLQSEGRQQAIYKHAISTVIPSRSISFLEDE